jgi:hypothetical protein
MELALVLVHLGNSKCEHLWVNAERIRNIWPELNVWIILDNEENILKANSLKLNVFDNRSNSKLSYRKIDESEFRNGFWNLTKERIFALFGFHEKHPFLSILHIENDVLLLRNFPFEYFRQIQLNAWMKVSEDHDSAAIIFLPNISTTRWLRDKFIKIINNDDSLTDMQILSKIRVRDLSQIHQLPTLENTSDSIIGFFDAASIGMWITGEEPRNNFGITRRFNNRFNLDFFRLLDKPFKLNGDNLETLDGKQTPIYNLHIHSKNISFLGLDAEKELFSVLLPNSRFFRRYSFSPEILIEVIVEYRSRRKVFSLILALPGIRIIRNWLVSKMRVN